MRAIVLCSILIGLVIGSKATIYGMTEDNVVSNYRELLNSLDKQQVNNVKAAVLNYQYLFKDKDTTTCDAGYAAFEQFYDDVLEEANKKQTSIDGLNPKRLQEFKDALKSYGFEMYTSSRGETYLKQNREFISAAFYPFVSPLLKRYLEQMSKESKEGFTEEGRLTITPEQLADRYVWWNVFCKENKTFPLIGNATRKESIYTKTILNGIEETPVFYVEDPNEYYTKVYRYLSTKYVNAECAKEMQLYFFAVKTQNVDVIQELKLKLLNNK